MATVVPFFAVLFIASSSFVVGGHVGLKSVKETCIDTPFPKTCISALSSLNESGDSTEMAFAEMMVTATLPSLANASRTAGAQKVEHEHLYDEDSRCFTGCKEEMDNTYKNLDVVYEDGDDYCHVKLLEIRNFLKEAKEKHYEWNCDKCRHGEMKKIVDAISKGNRAEKRMAVLSVLLDRVPK